MIATTEAITEGLLEELGVRREITVTADPALLLEPEPLTLDEILRAEAIDPDARLIGFSVREPGPAARTWTWSTTTAFSRTPRTS